MDLFLLFPAAIVLAVIVITLLRLRDSYEEAYENEQAFFRNHRPRMWELLDGVTGTGERSGSSMDRPTGLCPICGVENDPTYSYCRSCNHRLPTQNE